MQTAKIRWAAIAAGLALTLACAMPGSAAAAGQRGGVYWGAWIGSQLTGASPPWDMSAVTRFQQPLGKRPSLIEFSGPFLNCNGSPCAPEPFPTAGMTAIRAYGAIPVFSWGSEPNPGQTEEPAFRLADLISGTYDSYIREFAEAARDWGHPFFLRFDWEMNGNWFPWAAGVNGNQPGEFVTAWRHVHDIFTEVGATNASWVWCPYTDPSFRFGGLSSYYPGNSYVDWTCLDGYNWSRNPVNPAPWRNFSQIFTTSYYALVKKIAPSKPMMLGEVASNGTGRAKAHWIRRMFDGLATRFQRVRALIWFDQFDRGLAWPIETSQASTRAFSLGVGQPRYRASRYTAISGRPIRPPN